MFAIPASASAESGVPCVGIARCTDTFHVTGAPEFWTVPNGASSVWLDVAAGSGGDNRGNTGGAAGRVRAVVELEAGTRLAFLVGDRGADNGVVGDRGYGGGGVPGDHSDRFGAGGGGGSFVFILDGDHWRPLLIAGGGGGAGRASEEIYSNLAPGGNGGFSGSGADADGASPAHSAGAMVSAAGYAGGNSANLDESGFTPGQGQGGSQISNGGGGYFGGAVSNVFDLGAGGGSGFAASEVHVDHQEPHFGAGSISVTYDAYELTEASLSVQPDHPVVGRPVVLTGLITHYDVAGGAGTVTLSAILDGRIVFSEDVFVRVLSGSGPFTAPVTATFVPRAAGEYTFRLAYTSSDSLHLDATANDVVLTVGDAPAPPVKNADELAETGAGGAGGALAGLLGAGLLGAGATLVSLRRRGRR